MLVSPCVCVCRDAARCYSGDFTMRYRIFGFVFTMKQQPGFVRSGYAQLDPTYGSRCFIFQGDGNPFHDR